MDRRVSTHFTVRVEGPVHSQRLPGEALKALEKWHRRFLIFFETQPDGPIQVVLHPQTYFHGQTGAPHWAGGAYEADGAIHVAFGGVARVDDKLERLLAHELCHAFVSHISGRRAPRWLQEGLAQSLSGRVTGPTADTIEATSLEELTYSQAQAFVEAILAQQGQASLRDALAELGAGNALDNSFRYHLGATPLELLSDWQTRLTGTASRPPVTGTE